MDLASPHKAPSVASAMQDERGTLTPTSRRSCESVFSAPSSRNAANIVYRCKLGTRASGVFGGFRQPSVIPATSEVRQRVLSARRLRMKSYQNQLADAQNKIVELSSELRILRTIHKRQDNALAKYESSNAELPQLLHAHAEELRMWQTKYRNLNNAHKELQDRLKQKENLILWLSDQNKYYSQLNKEKGLEDRQRLADKLLELQNRLQEKDDELNKLNRKMKIEEKNQKQQLANEQRKTKDAHLKLEKLRLELSGYRKLEELDLSEKLASIDGKKQPPAKRPIVKPTKKLDPSKAAPELDAASMRSSTSSLASPKSEAKSSKKHIEVGSSYAATMVGSCVTTDMCSTRTVRKMYTAAPRNAVGKQKPESKKLASALKPANSTSKGQGKSVHIEVPACHDAEKSDGTFNCDDSVGDEERESIYKQFDDMNELSMAVSESPNYAAEISDADTEDSGPRGLLSAKGTRFMVGLEEDTSKGVETTKGDQSLKEDISAVRQKMAEGLKERDEFLDTFCRQATNSALRNETIAPKKPKNSAAAANGHDNGRRRNRLLSALETFDI